MDRKRDVPLRRPVRNDEKEGARHGRVRKRRPKFWIYEVQSDELDAALVRQQSKELLRYPKAPVVPASGGAGGDDATAAAAAAAAASPSYPVPYACFKVLRIEPTKEACYNPPPEDNPIYHKKPVVPDEDAAATGAGNDARSSSGSSSNNNNNNNNNNNKKRSRGSNRGGVKLPKFQGGDEDAKYLPMFSNDSNVNEFIHDVAGPDSFTIVARGQSETALGCTWLVKGVVANTTGAGGDGLMPCGYAYYSVVAITTPGRYALDIRWDLDNYRGLDERHPTVAYFVDTSLTDAKVKSTAAGSPVPHLLCGSSDEISRAGSQQPDSKASDNKDGMGDDGRSSPPIIAQAATFGASTCTAANARRLPGLFSYGRYIIPTHQPQRRYFVKIKERAGIQWTYDLTRCNLLQLLKDRSLFATCLRGGRLGRQRSSAGSVAQRSSDISRFRRVRIFMTGDSQVRTVYRHLESIVRGAGPRITKGGNLTAESKLLYVNYLWDPLLETFPSRANYVANNFDIIVFGMGAWPASYSQWTLRDLMRRMDQVVELLRLLQHNDKLGIWLGNPAWPRPRPRVEKFRITNYRIGLQNHVGAQLARNAGGIYINFMTMSLPFLGFHRGDGMHYDKSVVLFSIANAILNFACQIGS